MTTTTPIRRPRPAVPPSKHERRRRVKPGRERSSARLARWRPRMSRRRLLVGTAGLLALVVLLGWVVWYSPVLSARNVAVTGTDSATAAVVRDLAAVPDGLPLARVDIAGIEATLAAQPEFESVTVERDWPATVRIAVVPRVGLAVVDVAGVRWLIDRTGTLFAQVTTAPPGMPTLQVEAAGPGDRATTAALAVVAALPPDIAERVSVVAAQSPYSVVLTLAGGRTVIWGSAADSERKALVLAGVFDRPGRTIDVSSPDTVVIR